MKLFSEAFDQGIKKSGISRHMISVASDIPFLPELVKELGIDFFQTLRGRPIAFGTGLKLANPSLKVVSVVGDLMTLGGNHFVHAARRNMELVVICINNFVYKRINGIASPQLEESEVANLSFSPYSTFEEPFNMPHLGNSCGAVYTARWTGLHTEELANSIAEALNKKGLSLIEVILPGPNFYTEIETTNSRLLNFYFENSIAKDGANPRDVGITAEQKIVVGRFTNKERPTFIECYNTQLGKILGDKFTPYPST